MVSIILYGLVMTAVILVCDSARILVVIPTPSISHQVVFRPVTLELAKRGHEVVVITTDPIFVKGKAPQNYTEIDVHDISYKRWEKFLQASVGKTDDLLDQLKIAIEEVNMIFETQMEIKEVQKLINDKEQKFDLLFIEACVRSTLALTEVLKVPTIQISSFGAIPGMYEAVGAPTHVSFYPLPFRQRIVNLSVWEKISEYYSYYLVGKIFEQSEKIENDKLKKIYGQDFPALNELRKNIDMMFLNVYPMWDFNRPIPPNVIYLGGLHQNRQNPLPRELKSWLDSSTNGVIYMSLGTNVKSSTLPKETVKIFLKVFASLPYNVLWKWDQDELEGRPNNVNISKWFPQSDLLRHPNIKLFITQGGLQSTDESIAAGVPLIGIPMLIDQWYNTELYVHHKIGIKLDIERLSEKHFMDAINTVIKDHSYRNNVEKLGNIMRDQPQTPLERAIWWTEYVLRHKGARHLRSPAANITWIEYLELKVLSLVLIALTVLSVTCVFVVKLIWKFIFYRFLKLKTN